MQAIACISDFIKFMLFIIKLIKFELHNNGLDQRCEKQRKRWTNDQNDCIRWFATTAGVSCDRRAFIKRGPRYAVSVSKRRCVRLSVRTSVAGAMRTAEARP